MRCKNQAKTPKAILKNGHSLHLPTTAIRNCTHNYLRFCRAAELNHTSKISNSQLYACTSYSLHGFSSTLFTREAKALRINFSKPKKKNKNLIFINSLQKFSPPSRNNFYPKNLYYFSNLPTTVIYSKI